MTKLTARFNTFERRNPSAGFRLLTACALAMCLAGAAPAAAWADILPSDLVAGKTVEERALDASLCPDVMAPYAMLVSSDGEVLFGRDDAAPVKIASITKVMTAIVALENAPLDTLVTVDEEAATVGESSAGLRLGESMPLETALYALMVPSGNDAAIAIAKAVGTYMTGSPDGAYETFIAAMNAKAAELGCTDTLYTNAHGLDADAYASDAHSTAADVALQVSHAMHNDVFRTVVRGGSTTITVNTPDGGARDVYLETTDELMGVYEGICGVKTGTTDEAGYCFAGAVQRETGEFYSVILNAPDTWQRFADTMALMDWAYDNLFEQRLIQVNQRYGEGGAAVALVAEVAHTEWVDCTIPATVADPSATAEIFKFQGPVEQQVTFATLEGDVNQGDVVGALTFTQDGQTIATCDLIAAASQKAPGFFEGIGVSLDRFVRGLQDQPLVAQSVCYNRVASLSDR